MDKWAEIRRLVFVEGNSKRSVCRQFGIHWDTLSKILEHSEPPGYRLREPRHKRKLGPYLGVIEEILRLDQTLAIGAISYDAVRVVLQGRQERPVGLFCLDGRPHLKLVHVETPNLGAYRALVAGGAS